MFLAMLASSDHPVGVDTFGAAARKNKGTCSSPPTMIVNPYKVLQVRRDATTFEIRQAYRRLALWHHPGRCCGSGNNNTMEQERHWRIQVFEILAASYETLLDKESRTRCDSLLRETLERRSKQLPAGKICVGGKPLPFSSSTTDSQQQQQQDTANTNNNLMARVIAQLSMRKTRSEEEDGTMPPMAEPMSSSSSSSDSSAAGDTNHEHDDDDDDDTDTDDEGSTLEGSSSGLKQLYSLPTLQSPRIHMPLGTPFGTPRAAFLSGDPFATLARTKSPGSMSSFGCGMDHGVASYETAAIPFVTTTSSTTTEGAARMRGSEMHYTEGETRRLFGGPLSLLYRARRWKPFRNPNEVFCQAFNSDIVLGPTTNNTMIKSNSKESLPSNEPIPPPDAMEMDEDFILLPTLNSALWTGSSETLLDGTLLVRTSRILRNRRMIRTETVYTDRTTGQKHSSICVTSELLEDELQPDNNNHKDDHDCEFQSQCSTWNVCGDHNYCFTLPPLPSCIWW